MRQPATLCVEERVTALRGQLGAALRDHRRLVYSNSLGAEAMVLTDLIWSSFPEIEVFTIDTGRLHEETHELIERLQRRYRRRLRIVYPDAQALESLVAAQGSNGFYASLEARLRCCEVRKVEPFKRAIAGFDGWITGVRREQSSARADAVPVEWDAAYGLYKISPLLDWTAEQIWEYIRARKLPYNSLHDRHYASIGCAPCTRAIQPGEGARAGRWWWEHAETRECGLHPRVRTQPLIATA